VTNNFQHKFGSVSGCGRICQYKSVGLRLRPDSW